MDLSKYITSEVVELSRSAIHLASYNPRGCLEGYQSLLANHNTNISKTNKSYLHKIRSKYTHFISIGEKKSRIFLFFFEKESYFTEFGVFCSEKMDDDVRCKK